MGLIGAFRNALRNRRILSRSFLRLVSGWVEHGDVWCSEEVDLRPSWLGSTYDFWHYLDGDSTVEVRSPEEIWSWLTQCEKKSDLELFHERDYWQHPLTFEKLRAGDCEDHALWAWRKLGELGIPARFFVGRWQWHFKRGEVPAFHAWVTYEDGDGEFLVEAMAGDVASMVRPLPSVKGEYSPHFSVGHLRDIRMYGGFLQYREWQGKNRGHLWNGDPRRPLVGDWRDREEGMPDGTTAR